MGLLATPRLTVTVLVLLATLLLCGDVAMAFESSGRVLRQVESQNVTFLARDLLDPPNQPRSQFAIPPPAIIAIISGCLFLCRILMAVCSLSNRGFDLCTSTYTEEELHNVIRRNGMKASFERIGDRGVMCYDGIFPLFVKPDYVEAAMLTEVFEGNVITTEMYSHAARIVNEHVISCLIGKKKGLSKKNFGVLKELSYSAARTGAAVATEYLQTNFPVSNVKVEFMDEGSQTNIRLHLARLGYRRGYTTTTVFKTALIVACELTAPTTSIAPVASINPSNISNGSGQSSLDLIPMAIVVSERSLKAST